MFLTFQLSRYSNAEVFIVLKNLISSEKELCFAVFDNLSLNFSVKSMKIVYGEGNEHAYQ